MEDHAFYETDLLEVVLPDSLEVVCPYAFAYNNRVRRIELGSALRFIGTFAFADYYELEEVTVRAVEPPQVAETSFDAMPDGVRLRVPAESVDKYRSDPVWGRFCVESL